MLAIDKNQKAKRATLVEGLNGYSFLRSINLYENEEFNIVRLRSLLKKSYFFKRRIRFLFFIRR